MAFGISITSDCNLNCRTCGGWETTKHSVNKVNNVLPLEAIKKILDEGKKRGHKYVEISGGEPLLHPEIIEILSYAEQSGYLTSMLTNGLLLNEKTIQHFSTIKVMWRLSLYSANKETHEYFSGEGTYDLLVDIIRLLKRKRMYFGINMPVFKENVNQIEDTIKFALKESCAFIRVIPCAKFYKAENENVDVNLFEQIISSIIEAIIKFKDQIILKTEIPIKIPYPIEMLTTRRCAAGYNLYQIDSEMVIHPCAFLSNTTQINRIKFTDCRDFDAMNSYMDSYFEKLVGILEGVCKSCEYHTICIGGCLFEKIARGLKPNESQPICLKKIIHKVMKRYDSKVTEDIVQSWVFSCYNDSYEDSGGRMCMRRLPIWNLNLKNPYNQYK